MAKMQFTVKMPKDAELDRIFATIPVLDRYKVTDKAIRAAAKPVVDRAKEIAPRSSRTGTAKKRYMKNAKDKTKSYNWDYPVWRTIKATVRKYSAATFAAVGPAWPLGNKVFFNSAHIKGSRTEVLWGRRSGKQWRQMDNWMKRAGDETAAQQRAAMLASLKKSLDEMMPK